METHKNMKFLKGHKINKGRTPWNKGKVNIYSEETKKHWSEIRKGRKHTEEEKKKIGLALRGGNSGSFKNGSLVNLGRKPSNETRKRMSLSHKGKSAWWNWKGEKVGYGALHQWITKRLGNPQTCEFCGKTGLIGRQIHWANIGHIYKRNLTDWIRLCAQCHKKYDNEFLNN